ncbi:MAG TPA: response regulator transcription factor [Longimicrobium sp.]|nr:response regulator transcription factor [Longimicrobium sp.]
MTTIRVFLVDDHAVMRAGLRALLASEPDISVVDEAGTGEAAVELAEMHRPDVVVMDLSMPGVGGLAATRQIAARGLPTRVLALTLHGESEYLLPMLEAGGAGYITKSSADTSLVEAIRVVARGDVYLDPGAARLLVKNYREPKDTGREQPISRLSAREREVLALTAEGFSSAEIGVRLGISGKTVETYRERLMEKLGLHHRSELVRLALREGLLAAHTAA